MEQIIKCKSLVAIYQGDKLLLDGPHILEFNTIKNQARNIFQKNKARLTEKP